MLTWPQCARIQHRISRVDLPALPREPALPDHAVHPAQDSASDFEVLATIHP